MKKTASIILAAGLVLSPTAAHATGGSDSPTPYTVSVQGVTLPEGQTFAAHGHVNYKTTLRSGGMHFDPNNNQPGGAYIGKSFFPIDLKPGECITWVQVHGFNEHFGEGKQEPVCAPEAPPTDPPSEEPTPDSTPEPTEDPTSPPTETPTEQPSPEPAAPAPKPSEETQPVVLQPSTPSVEQPAPEKVATPEGRTELAVTGARTNLALLAAALISTGIWLKRRTRRV